MLFCQADSTFSAIVFPFIRNMENRNVSQRADVSSSYCPPTYKKKAAVVSCSSRLVEHLALLYDGKIGNNSDRRLVIFESVKFDVDISVDVAQKTPNQSEYNKRKTSHKCTFIPHLFIHIFFFTFLNIFLSGLSVLMVMDRTKLRRKKGETQHRVHHQVPCLVWERKSVRLWGAPVEHDDKLALQSVALSEFAAFFLQRDRALLADGAKKKWCTHRLRARVRTAQVEKKRNREKRERKKTMFIIRNADEREEEEGKKGPGCYGAPIHLYRLSSALSLFYFLGSFFLSCFVSFWPLLCLLSFNSNRLTDFQCQLSQTLLHVALKWSKGEKDKMVGGFWTRPHVLGVGFFFAS